MSKRVKKWIKQIYNNIMWKAHKIIFLEMSEWYSKYLIIPFFRRVVERNRVSSGLLGVKSTCIAKNNAPCLLYFREILCTVRVFGTCWNIWSTLFIRKQIIYIYTRKSKLKCKWKKLKSLLKMKIKNWHLA